MKTIKIEKEVTKEDVYVTARTPDELTEVEGILAKTDLRYAGSEFSDSSCVFMVDDIWYKATSIDMRRIEVTIPQLAELLGVEYPLKQLPTLEDLIEEAKSNIEVKVIDYPCWVEDTVRVTTYNIGNTRYYTEKLAIIGYISKKLEEYL